MQESEETSDEKRMALWEHLGDLRAGLFRALVALTVGFCITYYYIEPIMRFLEAPLLKVLPPEQSRLYYTGLTDKFLTYLKVALLSGGFLVSPYLLFEAWRFVSPALYRNEKKFVVPFVGFGTLSFIVGVSFAYWVVLPLGYRFLIEFGSPTEQAMITLTSYFSLTLKLLLALGVVFELPVILVLLARFGIVDSEWLSQNRRYAFLVSAVAAAVITPTPDAVTMLLVLFPLYFLYEVGILGAKLTAPRESPV